MLLEELRTEKENIMVMFEYKPFTRDHLISYLKDMPLQKNYLRERQHSLQQELKQLEEQKIVNGESIEERIQMFAYGFHGSNDIGGSNSNHYDPDTLFNRWYKIYEPYESHRQFLSDSIRKILYQQWQMECIHQCVDQLEPRQRDVILHIYIQGEKVLPYCRAQQLGHNSYNLLKETALENLLLSCNRQLLLLKQNMEEWNAEITGIANRMFSGSGHYRNASCL